MQSASVSARRAVQGASRLTVLVALGLTSSVLLEIGVVAMGGGPRGLSELIVMAALVALCFLLVTAHRAISMAVLRGWTLPSAAMRAHVWLHVVPGGLLLSNLVQGPVPLLNILCVVPLMLFFWTGRVTWKSLYAIFGASIYRIFLAGNTGMMIGLPVLLLIGRLVDQPFFAAAFDRVFLLYAAVHFLVAGPAIVKIDTELAGGGPRQQEPGH